MSLKLFCLKYHNNSEVLILAQYLHSNMLYKKKGIEISRSEICVNAMFYKLIPRDSKVRQMSIWAPFYCCMYCL